MNSRNNYTDILMGVLIALLGVLLWYLSSIAIADEVMPKSFEYAASFITAITGTFLGAFSAFRLNEDRQKNLETQAQVQDLRSTLFTLILQMNLLGNVSRVIEHLKDHPNRYLTKPAMLGEYHQLKRIDLSSLEFLLKEEPGKLLDLSVAQDKFDNAIETLQERLNFHRDQLQPAIENARINSENSFNPDTANDSEIIAFLGERLWVIAKSLDEHAYNAIPETFDFIQAQHSELLKISKRLFPGYAFVEYTLKKPPT